MKKLIFTPIGAALVAALKLAIIFALTMLVISLSSCSSSRWYTRMHAGGCQQSQGFAGY